MPDWFDVYERLWALMQAENVLIEYRVLDNGEGGYFHAREEVLNGNGRPLRPLLAINRPYAKSPATKPTRTSNAPSDKPQPDLLAELLTLSHEAGHMYSWKTRTPRDQWIRYQGIEKRRYEIAREFDEEAGAAQLREPERTRQLGARMLAQLNDDERALIVAEEELASAIGREILATLARELGRSDGDARELVEACDAHARRNIHNHRVRLGLDSLTTDDLEAAGLAPGLLVASDLAQNANAD